MYSNTYIYILAIIIVFTITASGKYFEPGYDHHYVYKSTSDYLGMHNVTSVMKFHIRFVNSSGNGNLHSLYLNSFVQFSQSGYYADNPLYWNLSKPFLFLSTHDGVVEMVHIHPEDQEEVLTLKKVLASTLSVKVTISNESTWDYTSNERDHLGDLTHEYRSEKTSSGLTLRRYHRSLDKIERIHEKITEMDNRGTIHSVESEDSYIIEDRLRKDYETKRQPYPEEYVIKTSMEGDIGIIKANSKTTMRLVGKRRTKVEDVHHGLMEDDLTIKQKEEERLTMKNISGDVTEALSCIHNYTDKGHTNRTVCVNRLRQKVLKLEKLDYEMLAERFLNRTCDQNDTKCIDEKYLFTDIVARAGDPISQRLILKFLLSDKQHDTEALRRIFIHLSVIEHPIQETIDVVERICFGEKDSHHTIGKIILTETQRRACLCLGSMAKAMNRNGNNTEAERLMDKIHTWLYTQGDVTPEHLRPKRYILVADDSVSDDHLLSKVVLLHSLGNAGLQSSISHLKTFAEPNTRQSAWRRAALSSLRNYVCHESATILLTSILHDETESVRQVAWMEYGQHPKRNNLTTEQQNLIFSRKYTYETVMRARREAALDTVLIEFKVELPEIHWGKSVGNSEIGASFGVDMVNKLHIRLQPLSGFLRVNIFDRIYAEAHVGILGLEVDILKIVACYKGKIEYNMNVLKHFAYGKDQELFESFNAAADEIIGPIIQSVKRMSDNFKSSSGESKSVFQSLSDAIRNIPSQTKKFLDASIKLTSLLDRFHGLPLISRAKYVAFKLQSLAEDIKNDALNFYQTISDAGLVTLLHAEEQLTEATNMIMEAQKKVGSSPRQAFESLSAAKNRIKIGMQQILEAKSKMSEALSGHGGSLPGWLSSQEETKMLTDAVQNMLLKLKSKIKSHEAATNDNGTDLIDFSSLKNIEEALQDCLRQLHDTCNASEPFLQAFTDTMRTVEQLKKAVELIDKATKASQRKVLANFGAKFHPKFPSRRRDTDRNCGKGTWPSTALGIYNDTPGIDVLVDWNEKVPCPVSGYVMRTCTPDEVLIIPTGDQFKGYEVLIRNINPSSEIPFDEGIVMNAGEDLGSGRGKGICDDSYIHVAIRQPEGSEKSSSYIDPSSFVDNPKPFPKWEQECKEFTFKHIGEIIEAGLCGTGFADLFEKMIKRAVAWAEAEIIDKISMPFHKSPFIQMAAQFSLGYLSKYNKMIAKVFLKRNKYESLGTALSTACGEQSTTQSSQKVSAPKPSGDEPNDPSVSKKTISQTYEALEMDQSNGKNRLQAIQSAIQNLQKAASELPLENMAAMPFLRYGQILTRLDVPSRGGKQSMPTMFQMLLWKACPTFENGLVQGYGHICIPLEGCTGLNCSISIPSGITTIKLPVMVKFDLEAMVFRIDVKNESINIPIAENPVNIHLRQKMFAGYTAILVSQTTNINTDLGHAYQLTQTMHLCDAELTCLQNVGIFHDLTFFQHRGRIERSADGECSVSFGANFEGHGKVSAGLDINSNGQIMGGGIKGEINVGDNGKITGGFHGNTDGTWHTYIGTELDVGDGTNVKGSVGVDVNKDGKVSHSVGVEAQLGDKGSIGGFVKGNSDGEITAAIEGSVKIGNNTLKGGGWIQHDKNGTQGGSMASVDLNGKGSLSASVNASSDGTINAGVGGEKRIGNTSIQAEGHVHHDKNGTSGGISVAAQFGNDGQLMTSIEGNSNGEITGGLEGDMKLGNGSSVHGALNVHHDKNGTSGGGLLSGNFGKDGHLQASIKRGNSGAIDAGLGGQLNMGNTSIGGEAHVHHDQNGTSGGGSLSAQFGNNNSLAASVEGNSDGAVKTQVEGTVHVGNSTVQGAGYVQHDRNGTSGGGMLSGDFGQNGHFQSSVNRSNIGAIDAGLGGQLNMGNTSIGGEAHMQHDQNGTSGGGSLSAQFRNNNSLAASVEGNSDGTVKAQVEGTVHVGNDTVHGAGYVQHDRNGTSAGGMLSGDLGEEGYFQSSVNRSNSGAIDAGLGGQLNMGNTSIGGEAHIHHDQNGTSGGGFLSAQFGNNNSLAASVEGNSDGTVKAQVEGTVHVGNSTVQGAGYVHHDRNGTSGGGMLSGDFGQNGHFQSSVNRSNIGAIDAGLGGQLNMGNTSIGGEAHIQHDQNGTSGGGSLSAQFRNNNSLAASVEGNSDGTVKAQVEGTVHVGNDTVHGAGYVQHDRNGTSAGGMLSGDLGEEGYFQSSVNRSNSGAIDAGLGGQLNMGNTSIGGEAHIHHDQNGTSGGGFLSAQFGNNNSLAASVEGNSDGTVKAQVEGTVHVRNSTVQGAGYVQHDRNGTSGGGMLSGDFGQNGHFQSSVNRSNIGAIDAGLGGQLNMGNTSIGGEAHMQHDQNGTSGGGSLSAQFRNNNSLAASVEGNSDGTVKAQVEGTVHVGNDTVHGAGYVQHDRNGTSAGGMLSGDLGEEGYFQSSVNRSNSGAIDAGLGGQLNMGNTSIGGEGHIHHDQNGTSGGGFLSAQFGNNNSLAASVEGNSDGTVKAQVEGTVHVGNRTVQGAGYVHHDRNGTSGGGMLSGDIGQNGHFQSSVNRSNIGAIDAGLGGQLNMGNTSIGGEAHIQHDQNGTSGGGSLSAQFRNNNSLAASVEGNSDGTVKAQVEGTVHVGNDTVHGAGYVQHDRNGTSAGGMLSGDLGEEGYFQSSVNRSNSGAIDAGLGGQLNMGNTSIVGEAHIHHDQNGTSGGGFLSAQFGNNNSLAASVEGNSDGTVKAQVEGTVHVRNSTVQGAGYVQHDRNGTSGGGMLSGDFGQNGHFQSSVNRSNIGAIDAGLGGQLNMGNTSIGGEAHIQHDQNGTSGGGSLSAQFRNNNSLAASVEGNSDGTVKAQVEGTVHVGNDTVHGAGYVQHDRNGTSAGGMLSGDLGEEGYFQSSVNRSNSGAIDAGLGGQLNMGNTSIGGEAHIHHDQNGTSGGGFLSAQFGNNNSLAASVEGNSDGTVKAQVEGTVHVRNSTVQGAGYVQHDRNGTSGGGMLSGDFGQNGHFQSSVNRSNIGAIDAGLGGQLNMGNTSIGGEAHMQHDQNGTSGGGSLSAQFRNNNSLAASVEGNSDGTVKAQVEGTVHVGKDTVHGAGYVQHDRNGTSAGGMLSGDLGEEGYFQSSVNRSNSGAIDAGLGGQLNMGNTSIGGEAHIHHDQNGTSGGGFLSAQFGNNNTLAASVEGNSDGTVKAQVEGTVHVRNSTVQGAGYVQHDRNGTSGGGMLSGDFGQNGHFQSSVNRSNIGAIDAGLGGQLNMGNTSIGGEAHIQHDQNGTSGGGSLSAQFRNNNSLAASVEGNSDGTVKAQVEGTVHVGNDTVHGAGYVQHDRNGTSAGGMLSGDLGEGGYFQSSVNRSNSGAIDAGLGGQLNMGNTSIGGEAHIHHDQNGTSGGGFLSAQFGNNNSLAASVEGNSDGTVKAQVEGTVHVGNSTVQGAGYVQHDRNGTSAGGMLSGDLGEEGYFQSTVNRSNSGAIDAGLGGKLNMSNTSIGGEAHVHHDQNGTSGGGFLSAHLGNNNSLAASVEGNSDGTVKAQVEGTVHVGNDTVHGAGYVQHDRNGTSGGGMLSGDFGQNGHFQSSVNRSNSGAIDAGLGGQLNMGNTSIGGEAHIQHDQNGTSGGGSLSAQFRNNNSLAASVEGNSDGTVKAQVEGTVHVGNDTVHGAGYVQHDRNGTSAGGMLSGDLGEEGYFQSSVNRSNSGAIDAGLGGQLNMGNTSIGGEAHIHHDQNGTSGGGFLSAQFGNNNSLAASVEGNSEGIVKAQLEGTVQVGNDTVHGAGYIQHDHNGTSGGGMLSGDLDEEGYFQSSVSRSNSGAIDAGLGQMNMANISIGGDAHVHHDQNGTSGGGSLSAQFRNNNSLAASVEGNSDGTVKAQVEVTVHVGNGTVHVAGYVQHDRSGTSGGGMLSGDLGEGGYFQSSVNRSDSVAIDAGLGGQINMENSSFGGEAHVHHDQNGTSGGGSLSAQLRNNNSFAASVKGNSNGTVKAQVEGTVHVGNGTFQRGVFVQHSQNVTGGWIGTIENVPYGKNTRNNVTTNLDGSKSSDEPDSGPNVNNVTDDSQTVGHIIRKRTSEKCSFDMTGHFDANGHFKGLGVGSTIPGFGKVGAIINFQDGQVVGDIRIGDFTIPIPNADNLNLEQFRQMSAEYNSDEEDETSKVENDMNDGIRHKLVTVEKSVSVGLMVDTYEEDAPARDKKDGVEYKDKHIDITIFKIGWTFGVGPIGLRLDFEAGGAIGMSMWSDVRANSGSAAFSIGPWVSGMVWGGISLELGIISGGLKLTGYILKTKFPVTEETQQGKHPVTVVMKIDLELTPIELSLRGWVKVLEVKVFEKRLWSWACEPVTWNVLTKKFVHNDQDAPQFINGGFCGNTKSLKRSVDECSVKQLIGRHPTDPAFQIEVYTNDENSVVTQFYGIGTYPGGTDVVSWTEFRGSTQIVPMQLPNGIPLYFTIKAENSQGLKSYLKCKLDTYDTTLPGGRVEASHPFTSLPNQIAGTVIMIEDSPVIEAYHALGYSPGEYGTQVISWQTLNLGISAIQTNMNSDLKYFSNPREGRLSTPPVKVIQIRQVEGCASQCKQYGPKCMSFDFEETSESCNFHDSIEGGQMKLHVDGRYKNYERLDVGYTAYVSYNNIQIQHGAMYYINAFIKNSLQYVSVLHSGGTMADFTPPEPGNVGRPVKDDMEAKGCNASVIQRCEQVTSLPNHRKIIDGSDGTTIFNGHKPLQEVKYTITNHYISANWDGFHDEESGIYGFTWASGTKICGTDILQYTDPHAHLSSSKFWTYSGYAKDLHLPDGQYYVTIQAVNNVVSGGAMVTTVCHSTPLTVDSTPPVFYEVSDVMYDEDFDILAVYYNVSDPLSGILHVDFGLGRTKHDVELRPYSRHNYMVRDDPFIVIENLDLEPGIPAWIRLRAVNNVQLFGSGHSNEPIMVDKTPPLPGKVLDGDVLGQDREYQHDTEKICSQWIYFYDPESGINQFIWGVGTAPGIDNILPFKNLSSTTKRSCHDAELKHNVTYYSTIIAYNDALNAKRCNSSSDGILVDTTPPKAGSVIDVGNYENTSIDIAFSSESATVKASWNNFLDAESSIASYAADIYINREHVKTLHTGTVTNLLDHSLSLKHLDHVYIDVLALNGADLSVRAASDGFLVDHTPPNVIFLEDSVNGEKFQSDKSKLNLRWDFEDAESGIAEYRYVVSELYMGRHRGIVPKNGTFETLIPSAASLVNLDLHTLNLQDGALYTVQVTALNKAWLSSSHESAGIIVDTSPPSLSKVHIGRPMDEEELDESGHVLHASQSSITVSWRAFDSESGIKTVLLAIGTIPGNMTGPDGSMAVNSDDSVAELSGLKLQPTTGNDSLYYVSVQVVNKAGLKSSVDYSKPIKILKANVAGTVYDGTIELEDIDFSSDATSVAMSFSGFKSEGCNFIGYEWAIGFLSYGSDVLPFTDYGIVMINDTFGHAQINLQLYENQLYFSTVRARTGHNCHEEYIVSTSDGFKVDTTGPRIDFVAANNTYSSEAVYDLFKTSYQDQTDSIHLTWNVTDLSGVNDVIVSVGHLPYIRDKYNSTETKSNSITPGDLKLQSGEAAFVNILATDMSGLRTELSSPAIVTDVTSPDIHDFACTDYISICKTLLTCRWSKVEEYESSVESMSFAFGTRSLSFDIANFTNIPLEQFVWTRDMHSFVGRDDVKAIFTAFRVRNILGLIKVLEVKTVVDKTPPVGGDLIFTTQMGGTKDIRRKLCQIPTSYVEVNATEPVDEESSIERYEIALGTSIGSSDILSFRPVSSVHSLFLGDLALPIGSTVFASMKAYNGAGLYSVVNSDGMVVSPHPFLTVNDGPGGEDLDFQSKMAVIEGNWHYSDPCPVVSAEWSIIDLTGKVLQNFTAIAGARNHFYNDELSTENGFTYISIIRIEDAIGRSYTAETDGVTIRIQTPSPGYINDGLEQDINFQISTTELSANWGGFGDPTSDNPVQKIVHYEVAVGNDRRFEKTRTNVHSFVNVGLNTSYTFTKLNLTTKIIQYYVTVRAYSQAGSFEEVYSNGIRVGYHEGVTAGKVQHNRYEDATNRVVVSWEGFTSDYGIRQYEVGISNNDTLPLNKTMECKVFYQRYSRDFDVQSLMSVSTNTYTALENLTLQHDNTYYVTVVATDESGMCIAMNAGPLTIDTTSPLSGTLIFDGTSGHVNFVTDEKSMHVSWMGFEDKESGIQYFNISLMSGYDCSHNEMIIDNSIIQSVTVNNLTETTFYNLNLESNHAYYITLLAVNGAGLNTTITSVPILLDTTYTIPGRVKIGYDWFNEIAIQSSLTEISTTLAVARDEESHKCPNQEEIISPITKLMPNSWIKLRQDFSPSCVLDGRTPIEIQIRHSDDLTNVVKGGISSKIMSIRKGLYTFVIKSVSGENMFASLAVASSIESIPSNITGIIDREEFSKTLSVNSTNEEERGQNVIGQEDQYGVGFLIPGFLVENYTCYCLVWAKDMYKFEVKFIQLDICADKVATEYGIDLEHVNSSTGMTWQAKFVINGVEKITINSLHFKDKLAMFVYGFNDNNYIPPVTDPFSPFETKLSLNSIKVPISTDKPCMYGTGFYDGESSIKDIWIGIANSLNETGNVREMKLEKRFCLSCNDKCPMVCDPNCTYESTNAFDIMSFKIRNLSLLSSSNISARKKGDSRRADNTNGFDSLHANSYFINVRILNFAGLETNVNSKAVIIDDTPPTATYVTCADPIYNQDEPAVFQGTNSSMAAFWDFDDDISQIMGYTVSIGSREGFDDIVSNMAVGLRKSVVIHNLTDYLSDNETYFITVTATNEAKLKTSSSCNITIDLNVPSVADSGSGTLFAIAVKDAPPNVTFLNSSDSIGVYWNNEDPDVEFFEMQIGSKKGIDDILPRVKIGTKRSKKAAVINGHVWLDNMDIKTNVQQFVLKNWTNESLNEAKRHGGYFQFEPGRCLNIGLYAISRSHLSSMIPVQPCCIKRESDVVINFETEMSHSVTQSGNALKVSKPYFTNSTDFHLSFKGMSGGLTVGLLRDSDWDSLYGSAASSDFKPYVSSPESPTRTSRLLQKRILKYSGSPFFIAPAGETTIADYINVSLRFNKTEFERGITIPVLAEWNEDAEMWQAVHENCIAEENIDYDSSIYKAKICLPGFKFVQSRTRRAVTSYSAVGPRMFALFVVNKTLAQSTAQLLTKEMSCMEDGFQGKLQIQYTDEENDSVSFQIFQGPGMGYANITEDGILYYKPNKDFAGHDTLTLMLKETSLPDGSMPKLTEQVIHIVVKEVNDPPLLFLLLGNETINAENMQHVSKNIEANSTLTKHLIGTYIAVDIDEHDNLSLLTRFDEDNGINVTMDDVDETSDDLVTAFTAVTPRTVKTFDLTINMSAEFYGIQSYSVRISDNANTYSLPITLTLNIMINPCVFGTCQVNPDHNISCNDPVRTRSFEFFRCLCKSGYYGQWCHLEIDECSTNPCPVLYDCHDMVDDYKCTVNILHLLLIILGAVVVVALCILVYRRIKPWKAKLTVFPSRCEIESPLELYQQLDFIRQGWQPGRLGQGQKLMDTSFQNNASDPLGLPPPFQEKDEGQDSTHHKRNPKEDNANGNDIAHQDFRRGAQDPEISEHDMNLPSLLLVVGGLGAPHHSKLKLDKEKLESVKKITPIDV